MIHAQQEFHMRMLNFQMHEFMRITWVSQLAQAFWAPKFAGIRKALATLKHLYMVARDDCVSVQRIYPHLLQQRARNLSALGLKVMRLDVSPRTLSRFFPHAFPEDEKQIFILVGGQQRLDEAKNALRQKRWMEFHLLLGTPPCCAEFLTRLKQAKIKDATWPMVLNSATSQGADHSCEVESTWQTNRVLEPLGLVLLDHCPCNVGCALSVQKARQLQNLAESHGIGDEVGQLVDILSWSVAWSTLHGITEVKTPVFKCITNAAPTAVKYEVRFRGTLFPERGAQGLQFPYRPPERLVFSESTGFANGLKNQIE